MAERGQEALARVGLPQQLIEADVERRSGREIGQQVPDGVVERLAQRHAQARFGERERALLHDVLANPLDAGGQRARRRVRDAPRLAEDAHRRVHERRRQRIHLRRQYERVGRERDAAFADAERELQLAGAAVVGLEIQVAGDDLSGPIADNWGQCL